MLHDGKKDVGGETRPKLHVDPPRMSTKTCKTADPVLCRFVSPWALGTVAPGAANNKRTTIGRHSSRPATERNTM